MRSSENSVVADAGLFEVKGGGDRRKIALLPTLVYLKLKTGVTVGK